MERLGGLRQLVSRIRDNSESGPAAGFVDELGARAAALENDLALMKSSVKNLKAIEWAE